MSDRPNGLKREDYVEPACPFCTDEYQSEPPVRPVPMRRVTGRLDEYLARDDRAGAERHLLYWLREAQSGRDVRGEFSLLNELMGFYRKSGDREKALDAAHRAVDTGEKLGIMDMASGATAYVNAATVCREFEMPDRALPLFEKARAVYERELAPDDARLAGLYNNMAVTLCSLGRCREADELYRRALEVLRRAGYGEAEEAVTYLNMANLAEQEKGLENAQDEIEDCLEKAYALLDSPTLPRNGDYAFYCTKCAPTFRYYGHFARAGELEARARKIYERS